jgi:predicted ribosome quality control (RQC) complex YloA/Tae2 family protein
MKEICINDIIYKIGKNANDNTKLIKDSNINWYWFHLDKFPSCHVIVCKDEITIDEINNAGNLVKENSKYKFKNIGINYCKVDNLIHGKEPGSVYFKSNKQVNTFNL